MRRAKRAISRGSSLSVLVPVSLRCPSAGRKALIRLGLRPTSKPAGTGLAPLAFIKPQFATTSLKSTFGRTTGPLRFGHHCRAHVQTSLSKHRRTGWGALLRASPRRAPVSERTFHEYGHSEVVQRYEGLRLYPA